MTDGAASCLSIALRCVNEAFKLDSENRTKVMIESLMSHGTKCFKFLPESGFSLLHYNRLQKCLDTLQNFSIFLMNFALKLKNMPFTKFPPPPNQCYVDHSSRRVILCLANTIVMPRTQHMFVDFKYAYLKYKYCYQSVFLKYGPSGCNLCINYYK